jgi:haloacetate dehalogenase
MWHPIAGELARHFSVVVADLRGYGRSDAPRGDPDHELYSKRRMARDMIAVMEALGHRRFALAGHDRGGRVASRMALDHPDRLTRLAVLDILPTYDYWRNMDWRYAMAIYHWLFLAQPHPLPERLIAGAPEFYLDHTLASWTASKDLSAFAPAARADYLASFSQPARQHAACEDYRAGATIDMALDSQDRERGRRISCPLLVIHGAAGLAGRTAAPLDTWSQWADDVSSAAVDAGHFMVEENPRDTLALLLPFLREGVAD